MSRYVTIILLCCTSSSIIVAQGLSAQMNGQKITLSDGRVYTYKYVNSNRIGPVVEMKQPAGAKVTISYDGVEAYSSEVPFVYQENDWKKSKVYFKLSVEETSTKWSVKLKHNSSKMIIDGAAQATAAANVVKEPVNTCTAMDAASFQQKKRTMENKDFADEKISVFKQIIRSKCISVVQIKELMEQFDFEDEMLTLAKLAYEKTADPENYYLLNDAFTFDDSVLELEKYLDGK
ncbi:MAG: DUF4476 domain-containing protein [Bacteroidota bacterium]